MIMLGGYQGDQGTNLFSSASPLKDNLICIARCMPGLTCFAVLYSENSIKDKSVFFKLFDILDLRQGAKMAVRQYATSFATVCHTTKRD
jgi:hypothetical protein